MWGELSYKLGKDKAALSSKAGQPEEDRAALSLVLGRKSG